MRVRIPHMLEELELEEIREQLERQPVRIPRAPRAADEKHDRQPRRRHHERRAA